MQKIKVTMLFLLSLSSSTAQAMEQAAVRLSVEEEAILKAIESEDHNRFDTTILLLSRHFKEDLKKIALADNPSAEFLPYEDRIPFVDVVRFYRDQILNEPIEAAHNAGSSYGYGTFRARWNISRVGAQALAEHCSALVEKFEFLAARARTHAKLWVALHYLHLYVLPALAVVMAILLIVESPFTTSSEILINKLRSIEAIPFYTCFILYLGWGIFKLAILKNFCGTHRKKAIDISRTLTTATNSLNQLIDTLQHFEPLQPDIHIIAI